MINNKTNSVALIILSTIAIFYVLVVGKDFLIPLAVAIMACYLINALSRLFAGILFRDKQKTNWFTTLLSISSIGMFIFFAINLIQSNIDNVTAAAPHYKANIDALLGKLIQYFGIKLPSLNQLASRIEIAPVISKIAGFFTNMISNFFLVIIYVLFLVLEQNTFKQKIAASIRDNKRRSSILSILEHAQNDIQTYLWIKTLTSTITGCVSYLILMLVGVDFAIFWAFTIFLLNYIPTVGSIIATLFPSFLALIQFETLYPFIIVLVSVGVVQIIVGNFLEPKLMGNSLNLSPLVVMLSLTLWSSIWGIAGMFLSVPITVIMLIVFAHFEKTRYIAILLSSDGTLKFTQDHTPTTEKESSL